LGIAEYARSPSAQQFCRDALAIVARLFRLWYRFRGDLRDRRGNLQPIHRPQLIEKSIPLQKKLVALAEAHLDDPDREVRNLATALFIHFDRLFTFLEQREWSRPTMWRNVFCALPCSGARSASATVAATAKSPRHAY
jgi:hypothetical protein